MKLGSVNILLSLNSEHKFHVVVLDLVVLVSVNTLFHVENLGRRQLR